MKTISYDSLIFDLDGTLWDTTEAIVVAWNNVLERNKINFKKIDSSDIKKVTGMQHDECVKTIFRSLDKKKQSLIIKETMIEDNLIINYRIKVLILMSSKVFFLVRITKWTQRERFRTLYNLI